MILVYSEKTTARFRYIARLMLQNLLGQELRFTNDLEEYLQSTLPKINYSKNPLQSGVYIQSANLLFETDIFQQDFQISEYDGEKVFFLSGKLSSLPFDPFAASFFLVSRYEEYIPFIADNHNRFAAKESFMFKQGVLHRPLVNQYAEFIAKKLLEQNPGLEIKRKKYEFVNTVDIDNAYAFQGKGLVRTVGAYANDLFKLRFAEIKDRTRTFLGLLKDPYETFDYQLNLQEKYGYRSIYFALFSRLGQYDRSLTLHSNRLQRYLKGINDFCEVGIHPSYRSNSHVSIMEEELHGLENVLNIDVTKSRQHFLKLSFPETYRHLIDLEITDDYSMGFAAESGFRAGICTPFRFYDLELETETPLIVHPFAFMDGTYIYYKQMSPDDAWNEILQYIEVYKKYGGEFTPIWHNRIFSEREPEWKGWNRIFEEMVKAAI
ncbi:hypothetical protein Oweho_3334 [Owenweeksia hongkongensis DSM 17368]|uniref:DUF7033 domain-containing protein n=1 Tax=Owenweeksia hongkongensis (strain DSM 17368 / CIP 108786 / JCM 12287 / NRRL B-23963 / UST20020801) TaxID=926562 RepID=G8R4X1_OWEHD|nr:polysaccharide deacetylase family protein [Owenweeksia hongkongensis]AEV34285.1 hypothetical protein Oweho_3334 [Owenweeksia hongkongensis DSM 17368]